MAKLSAKDGIMLIDGYNYSTYIADYEYQIAVDPIEVTGLGDGSHNFIPGQKVAKLSANGYWENATISTVMSTPLENKLVTLMPVGYALGNPTLSMPFMQGNFNPTGSPSTAITLGALEFFSSGDNAGVEDGYALAHGTITDTTTGTGFVDPTNDAVTAICAGALHIWTACAEDTYVVTIEHSTALASGYATLLTFTTLNGSAVGSERITKVSGTINKYRRVVATRTGSADDDFGFSVHFWHAG